VKEFSRGKMGKFFLGRKIYIGTYSSEDEYVILSKKSKE